ncbi:MAG: hypothetical protein KDK65_01515 [Chlamydiia bacterium]|nr:hypothetical protein [Chlamydiia bacterium]
MDHKQPETPEEKQPTATLSTLTFLEVWEHLKPSGKIKWVLSLIAIFFVLGLAAVIQNLVRLEEHRHKQELEAAVGVADIAMALKWAQWQHMEGRQNWSDPHFIQSLLDEMMPENTPQISRVFGEGQSVQAPYLLRIFTSHNLSRFLIVAQPVPNIWQQLIPKYVLIVDSSTMELGKVEDIKTLNRALAHPNPIELGHSMEIDKLFLQSQIIPLSTLAKEKKQTDLNPPKALKLMRPGAENLIYNAPRYHEFGVSLLKQLANEKDHEKLAAQFAKLPTFRNLVLYLPQELELSRKMEQTLAQFSPGSTFLVGSLKRDHAGNIVSGHLSLHHNSTWSSSLQGMPEIAYADDHLLLDEWESPTSLLHQEMNYLAKERKHALQWMYDEIIEALNQFHATGREEDLHHAKELLSDYERESLLQSHHLSQKLLELHKKYQSISPRTFRQSAIETGLDAFIRTEGKKNESSFNSPWGV